MADNATTSGRRAEALGARVNRLMDELKDALVEAGRDEGTVDAQLYGLRVPEVNVVGNLADLQRMGAALVSDELPMEQAVTESFVVSPVPPTDVGVPGAVSTGTPTATAEPELDDMTKAELEEEAKDRGIALTSGMTKAEITQAIRRGG